MSPSRDARVRQLWLDIVAARDRALELRDTYAKQDPEWSTLWIAADDLNQAARRVRPVVDKDVR